MPEKHMPYTLPEWRKCFPKLVIAQERNLIDPLQGDLQRRVMHEQQRRPRVSPQPFGKPVEPLPAERAGMLSFDPRIEDQPLLQAQVDLRLDRARASIH